MRKLIASIVLAGTAVVGIGGVANVAGASAPSSPSDSIPRTWSPSSERLVLSLIDAEPRFDEYASDCVLEQIEAEFAGPRGFYRASKSHSPRIVSVAADVMTECSSGAAY